MRICTEQIINQVLFNDENPIVIMSLRRANELEEAAAAKNEANNRTRAFDKLNLSDEEIKALTKAAYGIFLERPSTTESSARIACTILYRALTNCELGEAIAVCRGLADN